MHAAIAEAHQAAAIGEVPVGAVAVDANGTIVARAHNVREINHDPLGHAEILLLRELSSARKAWRLDDITIVVTCEPCLMCAGALLQARVMRVVAGSKDPKAGACESLYQVLSDPRLNHRIEYIPGVLRDECGALLSDFFKQLRK